MELEIPEFSMITDFEAGIKCIVNTSLISGIFSLSNVDVVCSFWKWGAIILAIVATFSSILKRIKIIHIARLKSSSESLLHHLDFDLELTDDDSDESFRTSSDDEEEDEPVSPTSLSRDRMIDFDVFRVKGTSFLCKNLVQSGSFRFRGIHRSDACGEGFGWADFTTGKNVVKLWDSLGLSLGFDSFDEPSDSDGVVSLWDLDQEKTIGDLFSSSSSSSSHLPPPAAQSRSVLLSAEVNDKHNGGILVRAYDTRMGGKAPVIHAEWGSPTAAAVGKIVGVATSGVEKVYVRDDAGGFLTVGDLRMANTLLQTAGDTEGGDMWWDADAVIPEEED